MFCAPKEKGPPAPERAGARGPWVCEGSSAGVVLVHDDKMTAAMAPHAQERGLGVRVLGQLDGFFRVPDRLAIDLLNHIARLKAGFGCGGIGGDVGDHRTFDVLGQIKLLGKR